MSLDQKTITPDSLSQSTEVNVQQMHAQLNREHNEPRDGFEPVPFWMSVFFGGLLFWGGMYISSNSANFNPMVFDRSVLGQPGGPSVVKPEEIPTDQAGLMKLGERIYQNCSGCHQQHGNGMPGQYPPLNNSNWVSGEDASAARLSRILLYGLNGEVTVTGGTTGSTAKYNGQMPAWGGQLKDHQIAAVLTYIRNSWDNKAGMITMQEVAAARAKVGSRGSMTEKELREVIEPDLKAAAAPDPKDGAKKDEPKDDKKK